MGLGVGLGAFVDGFARGYGIAQDQQDRKRQREIEEERLEWEREDRALVAEDRAKAKESRDALESIAAGARAEFDKGVASGEYKEADFDRFWTEYALPKMYNELMLQGDIKNAQALKEWGDSEAAKRGGRLFSSAMFKSNAGDPGGALDDAIEAGKVQGYIDHEFEFSSKEEIRDTTGALLGYRVTMKGKDGTEIQQDVELSDIPQVIAMFANPAAAWESQVAARAAAAKQESELATHRAKAEIDRDVDQPKEDRTVRSNAIKQLRERMTDAVSGESTFDTLPENEQEALIQKEIGLQKGGSAPAVPTPDMIVDGRTGTPVGITPAAPAAGASPAGIGEVPATNPRAAAKPFAPEGGRMETAQPTTRQDLVTNAAGALSRGEDPASIAAMLRKLNVPEAEWPEGLVTTTPAK